MRDERRVSRGGALRARRYTVGIGHIGTHVIVEAIRPVQFDVLKDLDPVGMICANPQHGTPAAAGSKLSAAMVEGLADPAVRKRLEDLGQDITPPDQQTAAALGAHHKAEIEKWWRPINLRPLGLDSRSLDGSVPAISNVSCGRSPSFGAASGAGEIGGDSGADNATPTCEAACIDLRGVVARC